MTDKNTRGRASKVDLLPPNIKTQHGDDVARQAPFPSANP